MKVKAKVCVLVVCFLLTACQPQIAVETFKQFGGNRGLSLAKPSNWNAEYVERNASIQLNARGGLFYRHRVLITIRPSGFASFSANTTGFSKDQFAETILVNQIEHLQEHFYGQAMIVRQEPQLVKSANRQSARAELLLPLRSKWDDSPISEIDTHNSATYHELTLVSFVCPDDHVLIKIYKSKSKRLNAEAEAIVRSINLPSCNHIEN